MGTLVYGTSEFIPHPQKEITRFLHPQTVQVNSSNPTLSAAVEKALKGGKMIRKERNFEAMLQSIEAILEKFTMIQSASIKRRFNKTLQIDLIPEQVAFVAADESGQRFAISQDGRIIGQLPLVGLAKNKVDILISASSLVTRSDRGSPGPSGLFLRPPLNLKYIGKRITRLHDAMHARRIRVVPPTQVDGQETIVTCLAEISSEHCTKTIFDIGSLPDQLSKFDDVRRKNGKIDHLDSVDLRIRGRAAYTLRQISDSHLSSSTHSE